MSYLPLPKTGTVYVANSSATSSVLGGAGLRYVPLRDAQNDYLEFQFLSPTAGTAEVQVYYVMSSAAASAVNLRLDYLVTTDGGNPANSASTGTNTNVTCTNDVLMHKLTSSNVASMSITGVGVGDSVYCKLTRWGSVAGDTHTGDFRVIDVRVV